MTWAARYSRTEQPELTVYRPSGTVHERLTIEQAETLAARLDPSHSGDLRADVVARVPVTECEEPGCVNWAMPDGRCHHVHGGSDEL